MKPTRFHMCLLTVGASSVATQLVVVREFMSTFGGNELVVGVALGLWLLAGGAGSKLAAAPAERSLRPEYLLGWGHLILALLPFAQILAIRGLPLLWVRGQMLGLSSSTVFGALIIAPYVLVSGAMIPLAGRIADGGHDGPARVYVTDTVGDIAGGLVFSLLFVKYLSHWQTMALFGALHAASAWVLGKRLRPGATALLVTATVLAILAGFFVSPASRTWRFPGQDLLTWKNTPFCQLAITRTGAQYNVWQDGILLFSSDDASVEALAHPAMCQVGEGADVLLVAGGVFGSIREILKHHPRRVDYVELDKTILDLDPVLLSSLKDPRVAAHVGDGRLFIQKSRNAYDAILVDLPGPENAQLNRFYTREFFIAARKALRPGGVLYFTLEGADNYLEEGGLALNRTVHRALASAFPHVTVFPGQTHYYLGSLNPPELDIPRMLLERGIPTRQLLAYDLATMLDPFRMDGLAELLAGGDARINRDLSPWAFGHMLSLWMTKSKSSRYVFGAVVAFVLVLAMLSWGGSRIRLTILSSGFAGMGVELALVLLFQVVYGYAYTTLCLFITLFMAGAAGGGFLFLKRGADAAAWYRAGETGLLLAALLALASGPVCTWASNAAVLFVMGHGVLPLLIVFCGWFVGSQFAAASRLYEGSASAITGSLYWADLAGASCGTLVMGLVLLPKLGIQGVLLCVLAVKAATWMLNRTRP